MLISILLVDPTAYFGKKIDGQAFNCVYPSRIEYLWWWKINGAGRKSKQANNHIHDQLNMVEANSEESSSSNQ